jgi:hypothetical protein
MFNSILGAIVASSPPNLQFYLVFLGVLAKIIFSRYPQFLPLRVILIPCHTMWESKVPVSSGRIFFVKISL